MSEITDEAREIWTRINKIAPYPERRDDATAETVARYLAVRAQVTFAAGLIPFAEGPTRGEIARMAAEFAAAHALDALRRIDSDFANVAAREIWSAWDDGQRIGEYLWKQLGDTTTSEVSQLADGLAAAPGGTPDAEAPDASRIIADRDADIASLMRTVAAQEAELVKLRSAAQTLGRVVAHMSRSMEAARIAMLQEGAGAGMQWILQARPDVDGNPEDQQWDGNESATEWLDRTAEASGE